MTGNEYQHLASRTIGSNMNAIQQEKHALHGMVGEIGELHSLYQKKYQGHPWAIGFGISAIILIAMFFITENE